MAPTLTTGLRVLTERVEQLAEALAPPADERPVNAAEQQARAFATKLAESQSQWFSTGGQDDGS